jgi:hypothetical protein
MYLKVNPTAIASNIVYAEDMVIALYSGRHI